MDFILFSFLRVCLSAFVGRTALITLAQFKFVEFVLAVQEPIVPAAGIGAVYNRIVGHVISFLRILIFSRDVLFAGGIYLSCRQFFREDEQLDSL